MRFAHLFLVAAFVAAPVSATTFSGLGPDDHVVISLESSGCFHRFAGEVIVTGGDRPRAEAVTSMPIPGVESRRAARDLSAEDLAALDEYARVLRDDQSKGYCTTKETFVLRWYSKDQLVHVEALRDSSCAASARVFQPAYRIMGFSELLWPDEDESEQTAEQPAD